MNYTKGLEQVGEREWKEGKRGDWEVRREGGGGGAC